ncbi:hypothetical protein bpuSUM_001021 (plasmid) [Borrelia puertoricensis]|nr:hypothetical protein bpuSUM_001021 [Borrelia puertoricensis]
MIVPNIQLWSLDVFLNSNVDFSILLSRSLISDFKVVSTL